VTSRVLRTVGLASRVAPGLSVAVAEELWFRPMGRPTKDAPAGARSFEMAVGGRDLNGFTIGTGDVVLLLHGWGGAGSDMSPIAVALADAGFRSVVIDLPGHGSDRRSRTDLFQMAAAIDAVSAMFGSPSAVVAHSFGAAAAFTAFPHGGPRSVVLIAPAIRSERLFEWFGDQLGLARRARARLAQRVERFAGPHVMEIMRGEADIPGADMLILHDPADPRTAFVDSEAFVASHPSARLVPFPDSGHHRILHDDDAIAEIVRFLA